MAFNNRKKLKEGSARSRMKFVSIEEHKLDE